MHRIPRLRTVILFLALAILLFALGLLGYPHVAGWRHSARESEFLRHADKGNALVLAGKFTAAIAPLQQAIAAPPEATSPQVLNAYNNLATAYSATGRLDDARKILTQAQALTETLRASDLAQPEYRQQQVRLVTSQGNILLAQGKLAQAEVLFKRAVLLSDENAAAHANLANDLLLQGRFAQADAQFDLAVARQPNNPETLHNWGVMLLNDKRAPEAEAKFRRAVAINPKGAKYYHGLGLALRAQSRFGPALQAEATAISHDPTMIEPFLEIADLYVQLKDYRSAETYLRGALRIDPNNMAAIQALARLLAATDVPGQRDYLESATLFRQAVDLTHEQDVNLLTQLADMYALAQLFDQADVTIALAIKRGKEQGISTADQELLLEHAQHYFMLQNPAAIGPVNPQSTLGDPLGLKPNIPDPTDYPPPKPRLLPPTHIIVPP